MLRLLLLSRRSSFSSWSPRPISWRLVPSRLVSPKMLDGLSLDYQSPSARSKPRDEERERYGEDAYRRSEVQKANPPPLCTCPCDSRSSRYCPCNSRSSRAGARAITRFLLAFVGSALRVS